MSDKLKPCPFCGRKAIFAPAGFNKLGFSTDEVYSGFAECKSKRCGAMVYGDTEKEAIKKWNKRTK